jgi:hypothetical protein
VGFEGDQTFGPATVEFVGSFPAMLGIIGPSTLTLGPDTLVRGRTGQIGTPLFTITGTQRLVNNGTIIADVAGGTITVNPDEFVNNGTATSANGGQLVLP